MVDQHLAETAEADGEIGEGRGGQQGETIGRVVIADRRERPQRLDKIAERAEPDHQDAARGGQSLCRQETRPAARHRVEIDFGRQPFEGGENRGMRRFVCGADRGEQPVDQLARSGNGDPILHPIGRRELQRHPAADPQPYERAARQMGDTHCACRRAATKRSEQR